MRQADKDVITQWLEKAAHDLIAAEILIAANPLILDIACFHCQQAVEKYLKAYLIYRNQDFSLTHNLDYLLNECSLLDQDFNSLDTKNLNQYAVRARYPHDSVAPDLSEAKEYYQIALDTKKLVLSKIS